ncbi:hypothetical protein FQN50_003908 [Emmonsiellopsis sp. PD_5]|nr:hypothetical protein FQN50_003908 [Emmonsiellopsis sp. PD_5]
MTSPRPNLGASAPSTQPLTPPADAPTTSNNPTSQATATTAATTAPSPAVAHPTQIPATSLQDTGKSRRPRDARLIHMLLASLGVTSYQERVPLQLLDFAYRYTSSTLQDAVYLATEGYPGESAGGGAGAGANKAGGADGKTPADLNPVSLGALRMSIASRLHYQFQPGLPKEFLMDIAAERNRMMLPGVMRGVDSGSSSAANAGASSSIMMGGVRLPPERFCLTGVGWGLKEEWESEGEEEMEVDNVDGNAAQGGFSAKEDGGGVEGEDEDDGDGTMEDIFGDGELDENGQDGDKTMTDV